MHQQIIEVSNCAKTAVFVNPVAYCVEVHTTKQITFSKATFMLCTVYAVIFEGFVRISQMATQEGF